MESPPEIIYFLIYQKKKKERKTALQGHQLCLVCRLNNSSEEIVHMIGSLGGIPCTREEQTGAERPHLASLVVQIKVDWHAAPLIC